MLRSGGDSPMGSQPSPVDSLALPNGHESGLSGGHKHSGARPQSMFEARDPSRHQHWRKVGIESLPCKGL